MEMRDIIVNFLEKYNWYLYSTDIYFPQRIYQLAKRCGDNVKVINQNEALELYSELNTK